jgi:PQQ-dependent catabolism-associated CXXCW motif protein
MGASAMGAVSATSNVQANLTAPVRLAAAHAQAPAPPTQAPEDTGPVAEPEGYWTGPANSPTPDTLQGGKVIHVEELTTLLKHGNVLVIDVSNKPKRPEGLAKDSPWLPVPQQVIPGSLWMPGAGMGTIDRAVETLYKKRLNVATASNPTFPIVIYCHERCWLSWNAAKRAVSYGYRNVYWFPDGIEGWKAAGHPTVTVEPVEPKRAKPQK